MRKRVGQRDSRMLSLFFRILIFIVHFPAKVVVSNDEQKTVIEGIPVDLGRKERLVDVKQVNKSECCPICALDLKLNYTASVFEVADLFSAPEGIWPTDRAKTELLFLSPPGRSHPVAVPGRRQQNHTVSQIEPLRKKVLPNEVAHSTGPEVQSATEADRSR